MHEIEHYWKACKELISLLKEGAISSIVPIVKEEDLTQWEVITSLKDTKGKKKHTSLTRTPPTLSCMTQAMKATLFAMRELLSIEPLLIFIKHWQYDISLNSTTLWN